MIRKIVTTKEPSLRRKSTPVRTIDKKIISLIQDMKDTLESQRDPEGVGLAAPQIGKNLRIFLVKHGGVERVVINPEILSVEKVKKPVTRKKTTKKKKEILEGCLSLPHFYGPLTRPAKIKIKYKNEKGQQVTEEFTGFLAQIVQHEIDHLNGILFVDRILEQKSHLYRFKGEEWEEVKLV